MRRINWALGAALFKQLLIESRRIIIIQKYQATVEYVPKTLHGLIFFCRVWETKRSQI